MRKRITLLASVLLLWLSVWVAYGRADGETVKLVESLSRPDPAWARETLFLINSHLNRTPGMMPRGQFERPRHLNPDRIRVLVFGDSFSHGWALADPDANWPVLLERSLNESTKPGTFEVVVLARPGASAYDHGAWVAALQRGDRSLLKAPSSDIDLLTEPFDVVVLGFLNNDRLPIDGPGTSTAFGRELVIDQDYYLELQTNRRENPYQEELKDALSQMRRFAGTTPLLWAPLEQRWPQSVIEENRALYEEAGFIPVDMEATRTLHDRYQITELSVTSSDSHPSPALTKAYASDVAPAVLEQVQPERLKQAMNNAVPVEYHRISGVLPTWLDVEVHPTRSNVRVTLGTLDAATSFKHCGSNYSPRPELRQVCTATDQYVEISGKRYPHQAFPCSMLGRPYLHIQTDPSHVGGVSVSVRTTDRTKVDVFAYGYGDDGFPLTEPLGVSGTGETLSIPAGAGLHGVFVASRSVMSCDLADTFVAALSPLEVLIKF